MEKITKLVVLGLVLNDKEELLLSRRYDPDYPEAHLKWDLVGGTNEFGELLEETATREIKEETGYMVKTERMLPTYTSKIWRGNEKDMYCVVVCFVCKLVGGEQVIEDKKIDKLEWVERERLKSYDLLPTVKKFLEFI